MSNEQLFKVRKKLNDVSPSFCLAKWFQVTIHLQNGNTHSCHHPNTHKIEYRELEESASALHNTAWKKYQRYRMLNGVRPKECDYCWKIEDAHPDNISDRTLKSHEEWAEPYFQEAIEKPWDYNHNPRYVEVSFSNACNFKCMYCAPHISSSIMNEYNEFGDYKEIPSYSLEFLKRSNLMPFSKDDFNPYVEAFWKWWPDLVPDLKVFRITGGEPLINPNTFRFLEFIRDNPMPELVFAINSNLGIPKSQLDRFLTLMKDILDNKKIKRFEFYTSIDTHGAQAEYIRNGLNYETFLANVEKFLNHLPNEARVIFMCTYNALSVVTFRKLLEDVKKLKMQYFDHNNHEPRVILDMPYLKDPRFMSIASLTEDFSDYMRSDLNFMVANSVYMGNPVIPFSEHETSKMKRIISWFDSLEENDERMHLRRKFHTYFVEHDRRKGTNFNLTFPEMQSFRQLCREIAEKRARV